MGIGKASIRVFYKAFPSAAQGLPYSGNQREAGGISILRNPAKSSHGLAFSRVLDLSGHLLS